LDSDHDRKILKGTRWLLLKNPENLDPERNEHQRLEEALRLNRAFWPWPTTSRRTCGKSGCSRTNAPPGGCCADWLARARASGVRMLVQFADTLESYQEGILAYYDYPISTGPLEGTNAKIQAMKRQAYGFRDRAFFKLKILGIHETKHAFSRMSLKYVPPQQNSWVNSGSGRAPSR